MSDEQDVAPKFSYEVARVRLSPNAARALREAVPGAKTLRAAAEYGLAEWLTENAPAFPSDEDDDTQTKPAPPPIDVCLPFGDHDHGDHLHIGGQVKPKDEEAWVRMLARAAIELYQARGGNVADGIDLLDLMATKAYFWGIERKAETDSQVGCGLWWRDLSIQDEEKWVDWYLEKHPVDPPDFAEADDAKLRLDIARGHMANTFHELCCASNKNDRLVELADLGPGLLTWLWELANTHREQSPKGSLDELVRDALEALSNGASEEEVEAVEDTMKGDVEGMVRLIGDEAVRRGPDLVALSAAEKESGFGCYTALLWMNDVARAWAVDPVGPSVRRASCWWWILNHGERREWADWYMAQRQKGEAVEDATMNEYTRKDFTKDVLREAMALRELVIAKNVEYAADDPLKCWRKRGLAGLLARVEDKLARWDTLVERGGATKEEWRELLMDVAGYALCALVWLPCDELVKEADSK